MDTLYFPSEMDNHVFTGRKKLLTHLLPADRIGMNFGAEAINPESLAKDLARQIEPHRENSAECQYLLDYYRGDQPILRRIEKERENDNHTVINFAQAITRGISTYTYSGGVQYVSADPEYSDAVKIINDFMTEENKLTVSKEVQDYQSICGTAFMAIMPNTTQRDDTPFELQFLSPVSTFVVYSVFNTNTPVYGCTSFTVKKDDKDETIYQVYTENEVYVFRGMPTLATALNKDRLIRRKPHILGGVPIVEFPNNAFRLGDFEPALSLLNSINNLSSDCLYNIQSVVTSYLALFGVDLKEETIQQMKENRVMAFNGAPGVNQDAKFVYMQLDGTSTEFLRNYLESALKFIVGIPDRDAGQTGSDTGAAAELRTGQGDLETVAKTKALYARMGERRILDIALNILSPKYIPESIKSSKIDIEITRINRADMLTKTQAMMNLDQMGFEESDVVYFGNITNDVSGVAGRLKANKKKKQEEAMKQMEQAAKQSNETEDIMVEKENVG